MKENETKVFCSKCGRATPNFLEWDNEFWCTDKCVTMLPPQIRRMAFFGYGPMSVVSDKFKSNERKSND